ncbi:hypothetical protein VaNZ11_005840 [Volvox africanus]|uniref:Sphingomyelin phosphodiesterase 4 n=1 Tax=Volvox africanus TaxID=51714 RepID=A0ABQ5S0K0_9CHLO|nr:hypothetical protein VaNZ11_005840 [Volvox africanus]
MAVPSAYGRDSFSELNRQLERTNQEPGSIRRTCRAVEECLANNRDNLRGFFDKPFSNLLRHIFGYGDADASWLNIVSKGHEGDARALVNLLAPDGKLFAAMAQADSDRLVEYIFPTERLPAHTQELLKEPQGYGIKLLGTWPQYRGRIRSDATGHPQVYLNLFEYFMFWTAFYVLRGSGNDTRRNDPRAQPSSGSSPVALGMQLVGNIINRRPVGSLQSHPYYHLLKTYLEYFLPRIGSMGGAGGADGAAGSRAAAAVASQNAGAAVCSGGASGPAYAFSMGTDNNAAGSVVWASYKPTVTAAAAGPESRGAILLSILVEFWLTDLAEPLPTAIADWASGAVLPGGVAGPIGGPGATSSMAGSPSPAPARVSTQPNIRTLTYQPPSEEIVEGLVALVRHVHVIEPDIRLGIGGRSSGAYVSPSSAAGSAVATIRSSSGGAGHQSGGGAGSGSGMALKLQPAQSGRPPWLPETPIKTPPLPPQRVLNPPTALLVHGSSATPAVQALSRKVYRQLRRAFSQWQPQSQSSLSPLISLWLSILAPWCPPHAHARKAVAAEHLAPSTSGSGAAATVGGDLYGGGAPAIINQHYHTYHERGALGAAKAAAAGVMEATVGRLQVASGGGTKDMPYKYTPAWRGHVLAHLPFYLLLLPQFASLSLSRFNRNPDLTVQELDRVLAVLAASGPELLQELHAAEAAFNDFLRPSGRRRRGGEYGEMAPWWLEQAHDFEAAAAAGSSAPGTVQPDVTGRLFLTDADGMAYTTCLLLRNAETQAHPELVAALRQSAAAVLPLDSILPAAAAEEQGPQASADVRHFPKPGLWPSHFSFLAHQDPKLAWPTQLWEHVYRGPNGRHDPMYRPIASNEIAYLVRMMLRLSERLNAMFGFDQPYQPGEEIDDPPETVLHRGLLSLRKRGFRFNLRFLAEIQMLAWILVGLAVAYWTLGPCLKILPWFICTALWCVFKNVCLYILGPIGAIWGLLRVAPGLLFGSQYGAAAGGGTLTPGRGGNAAVRGTTSTAVAGGCSAVDGVFTAGTSGGFGGDVYQRYDAYGGQLNTRSVGGGGGGGGYRFGA